MNKVLSLLGLARRAGKICMGLDTAAESIYKGKAYLLIIAEDVSSGSYSKPAQEAKKRNIPICFLPYSMDEIEQYIGKRTGIITVIDKNFSAGVIDICRETEDAHKGEDAI